MEKIKRYSQLETPCFILDKKELQLSIQGFKEALNRNFQESIVGYSVKTNSTPYCMKIARTLGVYAEVVSHDEYELAIMCGFEPESIIYNGPMKSKDTFLEAIVGGAIVNIETKRELLWLRDLPTDSSFQIGLRLNINISEVSPEDADGENDNSRFGFSDQTNEFKEAIAYIDSLPNITFSGLHIHRTAHSRSLRFYEKSISYACEIIKKYNLNLSYLDVGGGYFGRFPNKPTYQQYCDVFYKTLYKHGLHNLAIIVEPGNALVASCFSFLSEVIDVKKVEDDLVFVTTDGSRNDIDPFFRKSSYLDEELYLNESDIISSQTICGCTCLEYDRLFSLNNKPQLNVGDRILYHNVGAYTMCLTPNFIRYIPKVYVEEDNQFSLIRDKWSAKEYTQKSII